MPITIVRNEENVRRIDTRDANTHDARAATTAPGGGVQATLDEQSFARYLDGFQEVQASDLLGGATGGRLRYAIDAVDSYGRVAGTKYRLGGWVSKVDPELRFVELFNPYAKKKWTVQLRQPGARVRLFYMARGTSDEVALMRSWLDQIDRGELKLTRMPAGRVRV